MAVIPGNGCRLTRSDDAIPLPNVYLLLYTGIIEKYLVRLFGVPAKRSINEQKIFRSVDFFPRCLSPVTISMLN